MTRLRDPDPPAHPLRVAVSTRAPMVGARVSPEVRSAVLHAAALLAHAGHRIVAADPPYPIDLGPRYTSR